MGILDRFTGNKVTAASASVIPTIFNGNTSFDSFFVNRQDAMSVPALARARNVIAGTIGSLPLYTYASVTEVQLPLTPLLRQIDTSMPNCITMAWTVEDILFRGYAFWLILAVSLEDGRPTSARRIDTQRVTYMTDPQTGTLIDGFRLDGNQVPMSGVGSLIMFSGYDEGILNRAGRTIKTAIDLERAAARNADEPAPVVVLKNTGIDLPPEQVTSMMSAWKSARQTRSTAYVSGPIDVTSFGFNAQQSQLIENRAHTALEIARLVGLPAHFLNAENASSTYSNVEEERRTLIEYSLRPILSAIEQRLSMNDVTPMTQYVKFDLDDYLRGDSKKAAEIAVLLVNAGIMSIPDAQDFIDYVPSSESPA